MVEGYIKKSTRQAVFNKYNGRCAYCGCKLNAKHFHVDHLVPLQRGYSKEFCESQFNGLYPKGTNEFNNLMPSCPQCNLRKNCSPLEDFRKDLLNMQGALNRNNSTYRMAKKYHLISEHKNKIVFFFEKEERKNETIL